MELYSLTNDIYKYFDNIFDKYIYIYKIKCIDIVKYIINLNIRNNKLMHYNNKLMHYNIKSLPITLNFNNTNEIYRDLLRTVYTGNNIFYYIE